MKWTKNRTRALIAGLLVLAAVIPLGLAGGCYTTKRPPKITRAQRALINSTHFPYSVGVEGNVTIEGKEYDAPGLQKYLILALRRTGLFDRVGRLEDFKAPPDLVVKPDGDTPGPPALIPLATGLTLGLFPTFYKEDFGTPFSLRASDGPPRSSVVRIPYIYHGHSVGGWIAVFINILPNHTWRNLNDDPRLIDHFALEIVKHRREIEALAGERATVHNQ